MPTNINAVQCKKYVRGTGLVDCEPFFEEPKSFFLVKPGWFLDLATTTFDLEYVINAIQSGTFIPFLNAKAFTENTPDPTRQDYSSGQRRTIRNGNPDYMFEFDNGVGFHASAYSYNYGNWGVLMIDSLGTVKGQRNVASTRLTAPLLSDFNVRTYRQKSGDTNAATMAEMQIADVELFNRQMALITVDTIGANLNAEVDGIVSVTIDIVSADVSDGVVVVDVMSENNSAFGIRALLTNNFELVNLTTNTVSNITTIAESTSVPGRYTLTPTTVPAAGNSIQIQTKQYGLGQATRLSTTELLYRGISEPFTAVA